MNGGQGTTHTGPSSQRSSTALKSRIRRLLHGGPCEAYKRARERELAAYRELKRVEAVRANSERVAHQALALAQEVYGWAVHEPNHHRLLGRIAELRARLEEGTGA